MAIIVCIDSLWKGRYLQVPSWHKTGNTYKLGGNVGKWLDDHGHDQVFHVAKGRAVMARPGQWLEFDDPSLAMLFKLTWL